VSLAIVGIVAASLVVVLLVRLLHSTEEVARLLRSERPAPNVTSVEEDAGIVRPAPPDAGFDGARGFRLLIEAGRLVAAYEDAGSPVDASSEDAAEEDAAPSLDAEFVEEPSPLVETPQQIQCGWRMCPEGEVCCNWSCSTCAPPGQTCDYLCGAPSISISIPCGPNTCNVTEVCCNRSCGICVPSGETCSQEPCPNPPYTPFSAPCGLQTCNVGEVCCNPSCGICTKPGERCSIEPCR
jgi:hypothetical protein